MDTVNRKLTTVYTPATNPGFLGRGHTASPIIQLDFAESDPFILLMDDMLDKTDYEPAGGPHPHAGFETVSLVLEGRFGEGEEALGKGDFEIMTAGKGIVHTEVIASPTNMRLLQLWLNLPKKDRKATPRIQRLTAAHVPVASSTGVNARVYSGNFMGVSSPVDNYTPLTVVEITLKPGAALAGSLPADYNAFLYVVNGNVQVGEHRQNLAADQVGWLDRTEHSGDSQLVLAGGDHGARVVLYAAQPQHHEIVSHGPFIADSMEEIRALYSEYRAGKIGHIAEVPSERQLVY